MKELLKELVNGLRELELETDGIADEMTYRELETAGKVRYLRELAEEIMDEGDK